MNRQPVISWRFDTYNPHNMDRWMNDRVAEGYEPFSIVKIGGDDDVLVTMVNPQRVRNAQRGNHTNNGSHRDSRFQPVSPVNNGGD